jgi:hypothetical protein
MIIASRRDAAGNSNIFIPDNQVVDMKVMMSKR